MKKLSPSSSNIFSAFLTCLISFNMLIAPIAAMAATSQRSEVRGQRSEGQPSQEAAVNDVFVNPPAPAPAPLPVGPVTATKTAVISTDVDGDGKADPQVDTITYTATITNNSGADLSGLQFTDTVDTHTTLTANSAVAVTDDRYNTIGNVNINLAAPGVLGNDSNLNGGTLAVKSYGATTGTEALPGNATATAQGGTVTVNANGSFTFDPKVGFTGTDTFKYLAGTNSSGTAIATVTITVAGMIWFINNGALACTNIATPCGTLAHPFSSLGSFNGVNDGNAGPPQHPAAGDSIFIFESGVGYTGPVTLLNNQKLIGQDATASLISITGLTQPSGTDPLPVMNSANGTIATINSSGSNGINLGQGNTIRGLTISGTTGSKIAGSNFGTLTVGNNSSPDVNLTGAGQALNLSTGTFAATSGFVGVASTSSTAQGINLAGVAGTVSFGSTSISGAATQGILIGTTTANIGFGNTTVSGGTDGVSFQNNSSGTRTFGTLGVSGGTGNAFLHGAGGGNVTVSGAATLSSPGSAVSVNAPASGNAINFQAATSATSTGSGNAGVNWVGASGATLTFLALTIQTNAGTGLNATTGGTVTVTNNTGTVNNTTQAAPAIVASSVALNANFSSINSSGGTNGVALTTVSGTSNFGTGTLTGASAAEFLVSGGSPAVTYTGAITQNNAGRVVDIQGTTANTVTLSGTVTGGASSLGVHIGDTSGVSGNVSFTTLNLGTSGSRMTNQAVTMSGSGTFTLGTVSIFTSSAQGIVASTVTGTINCTTGTVDASSSSAINIAGTSSVAKVTLGMTLTKVSSSGGTATGIMLQNGSGSFTINGDGSNTTKGGNATGGTIATKGDGGSDNNPSVGTGIYLNTVSNITLKRMQLNDFGNYAVRGINVTGFTFQYSTISGANGTTNLGMEGDLAFGDSEPSGTNGLLGTALIDNCKISGAVENNIEQYLQSGTLTLLTVSNSDINSNSAALGNDGILAEAQGTSSMTITVDTCAFNDNKAFGVQMGVIDTATASYTINNNSVARTTQGNEGFITYIGGSGHLTSHITNNTGSTLNGDYATVDHEAANATSASSLTAVISGNNFTSPTTSQNNSIIVFLSSTVGQVSTANVTVSNNTVVQNSTAGTVGGILVDTPDNTTTPSFTATVTNNNVTIGDGVNGIQGIRVQARRGAGCFRVSGNTTSGEPAGVAGLRVRQASPGTVNLEQGASSGTAATVLAANNPAATTEVIGTVTVVSNGTCLPAASFYKPNADPHGQFFARLDQQWNIFDSSFASSVVNETKPVTTSESATLDATIAASATSAESNTAGQAKPASLWARATASVARLAAAIDSAIEPTAYAETTAGMTQTSAINKAGVRDQKSDVRLNHVRSAKVTTRNSSSAMPLTPVGCSPSGINGGGTAICVDLPTLHNGDSIQISYQVTVNNLPNLSQTNPAQVSNFGTVTGTFAGSPLNTNTVNTPVDRFHSTTNLVSDHPSGVDNGQQVTFTATVAFDTAEVSPTPNPSNTAPTGTVEFQSGGVDIGGCAAQALVDQGNGTAKATCQTSALTPAGSPHAITALYSGDGNFNNNTSNTVSQTVNNCQLSITVTSTADSGAGTLRQAILDACTTATIDFNLGAGPHTITLTTGELAISKNLTINNTVAAGNGALTISGNNASRVFNVSSPTATVAISNLTVSGGQSSAKGGGIFNAGTLTLADTTLSGNTLNGVGGDLGGGIYNNTGAALNITNSTLSGNSIGGGSSDLGGGIYNDGGTVTISGSTLSGNSVNGGVNDLGGGIYNNATLTIINSTLSGNSATGGGSDDGGGIYNDGTGTLTLTNCTVSGNTTTGGGTNNEGGGLFNNGGTVNALNTIVAGNNADTGLDVFGAFTSQGHNFIGKSDGSTGFTNGVNGDQVGSVASPINPQLGALANNGGPTQTKALQIGSTAIDAGTNVTTLNGGIDNVTTTVVVTDGTSIPAGVGFLIQIDNEQMSVTSKSTNTLTVVRGANATLHNNGAAVNPAFDQRGTGFPRLGGAAVDIGAFEANFTITATAGTPQSATVGSAFATNLQATVTESGNPVSGVSVTFTAPAAGASGTFTNNTNTVTVQTDNSGVATATQFTANTIPGSYNVTATATGIGSVNFNLTNNVGATTHFAVTAPATATAGNSFNFTVTAQDQFNNTTPGYAGTVKFNSSDGAATLPANSPLVNGTQTFSATLKTAGNQTITATDFVNNSITGTSNIIAVSAAAATHFAVSAPASATAGSAFSFTVTAQDQFNNTATGYAGTVKFTSSDGNATVPGNSSLTNGTGTFSATLRTAGNQTITATDFANNSIFGTSNPISVSAAATTHFAVSAPASATAGNAFNFTVTAQDQFNNTTTGYAGTVKFSSTDGAATLPANSGLVNGTQTFSATLKTAGNQTITATDFADNSIFGTSNTINVSAAGATHFAVSAPANATIGGAFNFTVTAQDQFNNTDTSYAGTVKFTTTDANHTLPANSPLTNGTGTFSATLNTPGNQTITATDSVNNSITGTSNPILVSNPSISVLDAQAAEPASGTAKMLFSVVMLAQPQTATVDFATASGGAHPATSGTCGNAGVDYQSTSGTLTFNPGETIKTVPVTICADAPEGFDETLLLNLSNPTNAVIARAQATGTIKEVNAAGTFIISETRTSGPAGAGDDFVELYNNQDVPLTINASDASGGYGLFKIGANCSATPVLIATIPNGTVIPARGHYLLVGSAYSLSNYGGANAAAGDQTLTSDIENDRNIGLFSTADVNNLSTVTRLDAVGFGNNTNAGAGTPNGVCDLLAEGSTLPPASGSTLEYSFFRTECGFQGSSCTANGTPKDTNNNAADFLFVDTMGTATPMGQRLGAPGPQNKASGIQRNATIIVPLLDSTIAPAGNPNQFRDPTAITPIVAPNGTVSFRRRIQNNTGGSVTALRFRIIEISTFPAPAGNADLRAITSSDISVSNIHDTTTCIDRTSGTASNCTVTVKGTTLEQPPTQPIGGGYNSTLRVDLSGLPGGALAAGKSVEIQLLLGVVQPGHFRLFVNVEDDVINGSDQAPGMTLASFVAESVVRANQSINFAAPAGKTFGDADFSLSAAATSGLPVSFAASGQCTVTSSGLVHLTGAGSCAITASQPGDDKNNPAPDVLQSFTIGKATTATALAASASPVKLAQNVTFTANVSSAVNLLAPTGTVQFKDTGLNLGSPVAIDGNGVAALTTSALTAGTHSITAEFSGNANFNSSTGGLASALVVSNRPLVNFNAANYSVNESDGFVEIVINRAGDLSVPVTVDYATSDNGAINCAGLNGAASARCSFGAMYGTMRFAAGETQKTLDVPITLEAYNHGPETFTVNLSNVTGTDATLVTPSAANVTINDSASTGTNAIDDSTNFVRQQYHDFLNREPDAAGLQFWKNNIDGCNAPGGAAGFTSAAQCVQVKRVMTSAAFFLSIEFRGTGGMVRDFYVAALDRPATNNMPDIVEFTRDTQAVQTGLIVGQPNWEQTLNGNRVAFMNDFVMRSEFLGLYPTSDSPDQYVDKLYQHANVTPANAQERLDAIAEFGNAASALDAGARGRALLRITENAAFQGREFNRGFVQMQYFGYLRRNPSDAPDGNITGYNFWVSKLNQFNGDFVAAEMVKAFVNSQEYRQRFGTP